MMVYKTLDGVNIKQLHETFVDAFSDYQVKIDMPLSKLSQMLHRRGYVPPASMGAFDNDTLVGFILNGIRSWNGKSTAYDTGTAVIEAYRRQGITSNMFIIAKQLLLEMGAKQYLLEVIQTNASAVQLYQKLGFKIQREFDCFCLDKSKYAPITAYNVQHLDMFGEGIWNCVKEFWDFEPSWQNSMDSINTVPNSFIYTTASIDNTIVGYGVIEKKTGDIAQIAVDKNHRGKEIGRSIITDLIHSTESNRISILNTDTKCTSMKEFLLRLGFEPIIGQYEMLLEL